MPCGINCDYLRERLESAEREGSVIGYQLAYDLLFQEGEINETNTQVDQEEA